MASKEEASQWTKVQYRKGKRNNAFPVKSVYNITNIQVGDNNTMGIAQAQLLLESKVKNELDKNGIIVGMLKSLFKDNTSPRPIKQIEVEFEAAFHVKGKPTFKDIAGLPICLFLKRNSKQFKTIDINQKLFVQPKTSPKPLRRSAGSEMQSDVSSVKSEDFFSTTSALDPSSVPSSEFVSASSSSQSTSSISSSSADEDITPGAGMPSIFPPLGPDSSSLDEILPEYPKTKRRKKRKRHKSTNTVRNLETESKKIEKLFKSLLCKEENETLKFVSSEKVYISDNKLFILDLASMWNVPGRHTNAYIVLGIKPQLNKAHTLIGIEHSLDKDFFELIFDNNCCSQKPVFGYFEVTYNGLLFGIIEIKSSQGYGKPCFLSFSPSDKGHKDEGGQLWVRENVDCKQCYIHDRETADVILWFQHKKQPSENERLQLQMTKKAQKQKDSCHKDTDNTKEKHFFIDPKTSLSALGNFKRGHYVLFSGNIPEGMENADAISFVPWVAVLDFDIYSRDQGLLSSNEEFIRKQRMLQLTTWKEQQYDISETSTVWNFPMGRRDVAESRIIDSESDARKWLSKTKKSIDHIIRQLQAFIHDYTVLTIVLLWPDDENLLNFMCLFLQRLHDNIEPASDIFICLHRPPSTNNGKAIYHMIQQIYASNVRYVHVPFKDLFAEIKNASNVDVKPCDGIQYELPGLDGNICINDMSSTWLREHLEVLYLQNPYRKRTLDELFSETESFFKGGTLHWFAWYEFCAGTVDVERDQMKVIKSKLKAILDEGGRTALYTLFHAPGSGGSTLAQRILWDVHFTSPCLQVKIKSSPSVTSLIERIEDIYTKTHLTTLVLLDGEDESRVKTLCKMLKSKAISAVLLYVKRYTKRITKTPTTERQSFLKIAVSVKEAKTLALKFGERCRADEDKIQNLQRLCNDAEDDVTHYMYEFGLATYLHEYKGITSYVSGYLNLSENPTENLTPGQYILGYLSLVYYYGQSSLPMQFFSTLLNLQNSHDVCLEDFPELVEAFVVPDDQDGRINNIRICHFLVAKEILEQILCRHVNISDERSIGLGQETRKRLAHFCVEFIEYSNRKKMKSCFTSHNIIHVLTKTFIYRSNREMHGNDDTRRRPIISNALYDIFSDPPLYSDRLLVLQKLTSAFPANPNFHAHLGRFYAYCRADEEDEVNKCFDTALSLCEEQIKEKNIPDVDDKLKMSIMHIYHMYGTVLKNRIAAYTGLSADDKPQKGTNADEFPERLEWIVDMAKTACRYFTKCREYTPEGQESSIGYVGEISVRLQACDFIQRNFDDGEFKGLNGFLSPTSDKNLPEKRFITKCMSIIDCMFMECYKCVDPDEMDHMMKMILNWYNLLMKSKVIDFSSIVTGNDIHSQRLNITIKKMQFGYGDSTLMKLEDIKNADVVSAIIHIYERIFDDAARSGNYGGKRALENDYLEWLFAIRHVAVAQDYSLEDVLLKVQRWNEQLRSPMSKFYLFVITSLLGFGREYGRYRTEHLIQADLYKEEMVKTAKFVLKPKFPREWLGENAKGIKRLVSGTRFLGLPLEEKDLKIDHTDVRVCTGTICQPNNKKLSGFISFDLGDNNPVQVKVFYIPNRAGLNSTQYANQRVEFTMAFSLEHGYEAFNVKLLHKYDCPSRTCSARVEISSKEHAGWCPKCNRLVRRRDD